MKKLVLLSSLIFVANASFAITNFENPLIRGMKAQMDRACSAANDLYQDEEDYYDTNAAVQDSDALKISFDDNNPIKNISNDSTTGSIIVTFKPTSSMHSVGMNPLVAGRSIVLIPNKNTDDEFVFDPVTCYTTIDLDPVFKNFTSGTNPQITGTNCGPCEYVSDINDVVNPTVT